MVDNEKAYQVLMKTENLTNDTNHDALELIGVLTDLSLILKRLEGTDRAISLIKELQKREMTIEQEARSYYFLANAWSNKAELRRDDDKKGRDWEQEETGWEILNLRIALQKGRNDLPDSEVCAILTNTGNNMKRTGRFIEARCPTALLWGLMICSTPCGVARRGWSVFLSGGLKPPATHIQPLAGLSF